MDAEFHIRRAEEKDIDEVMSLYEHARKYKAETVSYTHLDVYKRQVPQ